MLSCYVGTNEIFFSKKNIDIDIEIDFFFKRFECENFTSAKSLMNYFKYHHIRLHSIIILYLSLKHSKNVKYKSDDSAVSCRYAVNRGMKQRTVISLSWKMTHPKLF